MEIAKSNYCQIRCRPGQGKALHRSRGGGGVPAAGGRKARKVESPKRKKRRHVLFVAADETRLSEKIKSEERITNSELRRTLAAYREEVYPDQEG